MHAKSDRSNIGARSELLVCADLLDKGYSVFRSVSPACNFDLVAWKDRRLWKVEVKTAKLLPSGKIAVSKHPHNEHDVLVLVVNGKPIYSPEMP